MKIIELSKKEYKGYPVLFEYTTIQCYKTLIEKSESGFNVSFELNNLAKEESKSFKSELYKDFWEDASAFACVIEDEFVGLLEIDRNAWNNRLRITNITVNPDKRRLGIGAMLMDKAKEIAVKEKRRGIVLETQTFNVKAIDFYLAQGFVLSGFDSNCYSNQDIEKGDVRIELTYFIKET